ncbi:MAG: agmatinase [Candidatus Caldarchaeum sp.]|uniref:Agmatinase n=1 Tax=Caldiarchaeum subterraneum TaxID=311458 RepID=A0A7C5L9A9_CALS0
MSLEDELRFSLRQRETFLGVEGGFADAQYFIFGVPYDLTSSFRPGSRFGPEAVRRFSANIEANSYSKPYDATTAKVYDAGDIVFSYKLSTMLKRVYRVVKNVSLSGKMPVMVGGEHTFTYAAFSAVNASTLIIFDAHFDLRNEYCDLWLNHATYLRRLIEKRPQAKIVVLGVRAFDLAEEKFAREKKITFVKPSELNDVSRTMRILKEFVANRSFYLSVDLDVLDPCYAPGVGNPEPCGITPGQLFDLIHFLGEHSPVAFDVMELNPLYDNGSTAAVASKLLIELLASTAES